MNIHKVYGLFLPFFRRRRMERFVNTFRPTKATRILDVGGGVLNWKLIRCESRITILNLSVPSDASTFPPNFTFAKGDGTSLGYPDNSFDNAYSNSVIEHLFSWDNQVRFAKEISRVSRNVWVQTPARSFFVEPHLITPFIHFFPKTLQKRLLRNFTIWGLLGRPSQSQVDQFLDEVRLLTFKEMQTLFPDCTIHKERFLLFTKAYVAIRRTE
ncbi:MAG: methyltransferase domain-containing protein [Bacteroidota bacterium]